MGNRYKNVTFKNVKENKEIGKLIEHGNQVLKALGYTEHSRQHASTVARRAGNILESLGFGKREISLARIAGYMHDIGNGVNRHNHAQTGAVMAYQLLKELGMPIEERITVMTAIGNHDEATGTAVDVVSAALILADKTDVRRNRVQNQFPSSFDQHDRVNYAVLSSKLDIKKDKKVIEMSLELDDSMCTVMDYFEIFLDRMLMCKRAAEVLGCRFKLTANKSKLC